MKTEEQKYALRKIMLRKRAEMNTFLKKGYDDWICSELEKVVLHRNCKSVHAYLPIFTEININPLLQKLIDLNITVVCPKTLPKRKLENRVLHSLEDLDVGIMGTKYPAQPDLYRGDFDLIIVPGLAFDNGANRVGYGGGYYDNFLFTQPDSYKLGIFYPFQKVDAVPLEIHDIRLDEILFKEFDVDLRYDEKVINGGCPTS